MLNTYLLGIKYGYFDFKKSISYITKDRTLNDMLKSLMNKYLFI